jgi:hypothetical protein
VYMIHESTSKDVYLALLNDGSSENYASKCESDKGGKGTHGRGGGGGRGYKRRTVENQEVPVKERKCAQNIYMCVFDLAVLILVLVCMICDSNSVCRCQSTK